GNRPRARSECGRGAAPGVGGAGHPRPRARGRNRSDVVSSSLAGRTIVVTRPQEQAGELVKLLDARGALSVLAPSIEIVPVPEDELRQAAEDVIRGRYEWLILTSRPGVRAL